MISDVLSEASTNIEQYLTDPTFSGTYAGETRERIIRLKKEMDAILGDLDRPGNLTNQQKDYMRQMIGRTKFTEIAQSAGCSVDAVRAFTPIVFAERNERIQATYAKTVAFLSANAKFGSEHTDRIKAACAKVAGFSSADAEIRSKLAAGDIAGAYKSWADLYEERIADRFDDSKLIDEYTKSGSYKKSFADAYAALMEDLVERVYDQLREDAHEEAVDEYRESDQYKKDRRKAAQELLDEAWEEYKGE